MGLSTATAGRQVAFVASMGGLGNVLALLAVSIPTPISQVAPDLSHVATLIVALYSGPVLGRITGAIACIVSFRRFGLTGRFQPLVFFTIPPSLSFTNCNRAEYGHSMSVAPSTQPTRDDY